MALCFYFYLIIESKSAVSSCKIPSAFSELKMVHKGDMKEWSQTGGNAFSLVCAS